MPAPNEKLAASLDELRHLQKGGSRVFSSTTISRVHRERLLRSGFVQEVIKGWLVSSSPGTGDGESTPWYASFWEFCVLYCNSRFDAQWHLSPEQSLQLHAENSVIPAQVVIYSPRGTNNINKLPFGTSIYDLKEPAELPAADLAVRNGLRVYSTAAALIKVPESFFARNPIESQVALASLSDVSEVTRRLLDGGHSVVAGRLAGAFRRIGRADFAAEIVSTMKSADYNVRETDPFASRQSFEIVRSSTAPIVTRLQAMWKAARGPVIEIFPPAQGVPRHKGRYLKSIDGNYQSDAYHSLSIEGYSVTPELINRVRAGSWNPGQNADDRRNRDALAARGYWQAFQAVRATVSRIIAGGSPAKLLRADHRKWYQELFQPCVVAGLLRAGVLAGYRNEAVYLRASRYVPPRWEVVRDAMPALLDLIEREPHPGVSAVLGHWLFGFIHPYPDGNGRMARFLMNAMLASGGYSWTVIPVTERNAYLHALDRASIDHDIRPFARFIAKHVNAALNPAKMTRARKKTAKRPARSGRRAKIIKKK